jgi:hypothetical protein
MRSVLRGVGAVALVAASVSCGDVVRQGRSPVYLVIDNFQVATGITTSPTFTAAPLLSDVQTKGSVFNDLGEVTLRLSLKDIGVGTSTLAPTTNNEVTINRYHVEYVRADGRNTPGVDVPYPFDGAISGTVPANATLIIGFELVRHDAKLEAPLVQLISNLSVINTIAHVTFYGHDQVGNVVSVTGSVSVDFANFADPS